MRDFLSRHVTLTDAEYEQLLAVATPRHYARHERVFTAGQVFDKLLFVQSGALRSYRLGSDGDDVSYYFFFEGEYAVDFQSYLSGEASTLHFEALEATDVLAFARHDMLRLFDAIPQVDRLGRLMAERAYLINAERIKQFQSDDLANRYQKLLTRNPELVARIPQHHVASYLGVRPQSLSRVKAQLRGHPGAGAPPPPLT